MAKSLESLTIELPQYSRSFTVEVPQESNVRDVKIAVSHSCPGKPQPEGQRLIVKGRSLSDHDLVQQLWKEGEPHVLHLAVHPSYWSEGPPQSQPSQPTNELHAPLGDRAYIDLMDQVNAITSGINLSSEGSVYGQTHSLRTHRLPRASAAPHTFPNAPQYIVHTHFKALQVLCPDVHMPLRAQAARGSKDVAKQAVLTSGRSWPAIFDEEFPATVESDLGVKYTITTLADGLPYLQLTTPAGQPSLIQQHAIRVLSYSFPLLSAFSSVTIPRNNERAPTRILQPQPQPQPAPAAVQIRYLSIRDIFMPLMLLGFRTLLLLYFFSPVRKPVFSILLGLWVLYEAWEVVRGAILDLEMPGDGNRDRRRGGGAVREAADNIDAIRNAANAARNGGRPRAQQTQNAQRSTVELFLGRLARIHLDSEERALAATNYAEEPSFLSKALSFITLFLLTLHPLIWKLRRVALKEREGRIRAEAIKRRVPEDDSQTVGAGSEEVNTARQRLIETHDRRRPWVKRYIQRVGHDEWVDE